jgi:hypothetical protein
MILVTNVLFIAKFTIYMIYKDSIHRLKTNYLKIDDKGANLFKLIDVQNGIITDGLVL